MGIDMKHNKKIVVLNILFLILSDCGGADDTTTEPSETSTTTSSTTTLAESSSGEIYNEAELVVPPILLKPLNKKTPEIKTLPIKSKILIIITIHTYYIVL